MADNILRDWSEWQIGQWVQDGLLQDTRSDLNFTQLTPHRALSNQSVEVRWSMDLHYEATETATQSGKQFGFVARSGKESAAVMRQAEWLAKWDGIPKQTY